ncbi:MAG TPA: alpha/beta hydrolase [Candidatus Binataceae bacterium]|nr:alpha/beta hydrolase [Candidatus Binataceae bacterium]
MASQEWSERTVRIAGINLPVIVGGRGKPLLVLHDELGYPGWFNWQRALAKERTLFIPMAPGFGKAPRIEWVDNVRDLACVYARMLREEGLENIDVIGFSFGGWVAAEMIANYPAQFRRSVLVAPGGIKASKGDLMDLFLVPAQSYLRATVLDPSATAEFSNLYGEPNTPEQYELLEDARAEFSRVAWEPYFHNPSLPHLLEGVANQSVLLIWGRQDRVVPRSVIDTYYRAIAGSKLVMFENCGHRPEIEKTDEFVSEVRNFLGA